MRIEKREAKSGFNCVSCGERVRNCEKYLQVVENGRPVRGERYCVHCEQIAHENNPIEGDDDDGERGLREREAYAAYQYGGCTSAYWDDRDAGYIN